MKLRVKLTILLSVAIGLSILTFTYLRHLEFKQSENLLLDKKNEKKILFNKILNLKNQSLEQLSIDYTFWDDMVLFVKTGDKKWAKENIDTVLPTFQANAIWVFNTEFKSVYIVNNLKDSKYKDLQLSSNAIRQIFSKKRLNHFFMSTPIGVMEVNCATIHPTSDPLRKTKIQGYFFAGRIWNNEYLGELSKLSESKIILRPYKKTEPAKSANKEDIVFYKTLRGWNSAPLYLLNISSSSPFFEQFNRSSNLQFVLFIIFSFVILAMVSISIYRWVNAPLNLISQSLKAGTSAKLGSLLNKRTEFGSVSNLIKEFYIQKDDLVEEVKKRKQSQDGLKKARDELEVRVEERTAELSESNERLKREVSERKQAEKEITHLAYYDSLTDLPNRRLLSDRLSAAIEYAKRNNQLVALLYFDLDSFKIINDSLGHNAGDELLRTVAQRLSFDMRSEDTLARVGGDEFAIIVPQLTQEKDAEIVAQKISNLFREPFIVNGNEIFSSVSIGISIYPANSKNARSLISHADIAMYRAKELGRNNAQFYTHPMDVDTFKRLSMEKKLHHAIEKDELKLNYQPQIDIRTGDIIGVEALISWKPNSPENISTIELIKLAELSGLIMPIGEWVLNKACQQNRDWQENGFKPVRMGVNLSSNQFHRLNFIEMIRNILKKTGLDPSYLELELTENVIMKDKKNVIKMLEELKDVGMNIAIDDFGTGYSSLSYLKHFPIDKLKIDKSFIRDITTDPNDAAIVKTVILMAHSLNFKAIAEGVETKEQLDFLRENKCDEIQGFYFSRPLPSMEIEEFFNNYRPYNLGEAA